jgi:hypothetical protein
MAGAPGTPRAPSSPGTVIGDSAFPVANWLSLFVPYRLLLTAPSATLGSEIHRAVWSLGAQASDRIDRAALPAILRRRN